MQALGPNEVTDTTRTLGWGGDDYTQVTPLHLLLYKAFPLVSVKVFSAFLERFSAMQRASSVERTSIATLRAVRQKCFRPCASTTQPSNSTVF